MTKQQDTKDDKPTGQSQGRAGEKDGKTTSKQNDDQPGADGPSSAGASEDTYD